ncbi:MAG: bifunctional rhamnulose-1-phosphate aldolase/short-chain dehydrogenase [Akkermansiaceae bacterium]|nr:bifunctional rhamnulose-1-phosphate aldolase/short-chain dehydrogenase [Akkermansiaceae bacterium]
MSSDPSEFRHVNYGWDDEKVAPMSAVERLTYRSNILGADQRITNTGGGNTSTKAIESDPLTGEDIEVLWVKGSGGDLRTATIENFSSLYQDKLIALQKLYHGTTPNGVKTQIEDDMVGMYRHTTFNLNPRASSIDTPLHSFIPYKHVDHMHPNAFIALCATKNSEAITQEIFGDEVVYTSWQRPGFDLGLLFQDVCEKHPSAKGINMGQHGLINWANDDKECYELTLELIERAGRYIEERDKGGQTFEGQKFEKLSSEQQSELVSEILPWLRGQVSQKNRFIATIEATDAVLEFVNSNAAPRLAELGTSCPDHFLRTKIKPLYIDWNPQREDLISLREKLTMGLKKYRSDYAAYYEANKEPSSPAMRDPNPTVVLIPGIGLIAFGKNKSEARVTAEFYNCAISVMRGAEAIDEYIGLPQKEAFDIEYWALEEAKLQRMPPEREFARKVVIVVGAGSGIGREMAHLMIAQGAHVVCADINEEQAKETAGQLLAKVGQGIGVAGSGISGCGNAIGLACDVTDRGSIKTMLAEVIYAYGGFDHIAVTAGIFVPPDRSGHIPDDKWGLTFGINVAGPYFVADEAAGIWKEQGLRGSMVVTTSANAVVSKKGSVAYDTSKAAANHLVRELAVELSPLIRVNGVAPATVVAGSGMFPRDRVIASLSKYEISFNDDESTEDLRDKLAQFYADRTLTKAPITPRDQAEGMLFMLCDASSKTTGQILAVDGGLHEAFLR